MITRFVKFAKEILKPPTLDVRCPGKSGSPESARETEERYNTMRIMQQQHDAFKDHSDDLLSEIDDRIKELRGLKSSAERTAQNVSWSVCLSLTTHCANEIIGDRAARPQATAGQCCSGLRSHEARGGNGAPGQGHHGLYRHDYRLCK